MVFNLRNVVVGLAAGASLALAGCGSSFDCSKAACPNDPAPTQAAIDACNTAINDAKCGSQNKDAASCFSSNVKCTADGKTDTDQSAALAACATQFAAEVSCQQGGGSGSTGGSTSGSGSGGSTGA